MSCDAIGLGHLPVVGCGLIPERLCEMAKGHAWLPQPTPGTPVPPAHTAGHAGCPNVWDRRRGLLFMNCPVLPRGCGLCGDSRSMRMWQFWSRPRGSAGWPLRCSPPCAARRSPSEMEAWGLDDNNLILCSSRWPDKCLAQHVYLGPTERGPLARGPHSVPRHHHSPCEAGGWTRPSSHWACAGLLHHYLFPVSLWLQFRTSCSALSVSFPSSCREAGWPSPSVSRRGSASQPRADSQAFGP